MTKLPRPILILIFICGLSLALWPVIQTGYGMWQQHQLRSQWDRTVTQYAATHKGKSTPAKVTTPIALSSKSASAGLRDFALEEPKAATTPAPNQGKTTRSGPESKATTPQTKSAKKIVAPRPRPNSWFPIRLEIPTIGLDAIVVQGLDKQALSRGPGHDPASSLPGEPGNCVIAGHRNMYGWWFYRLGQLGHNALIQVHSPTETFTYKVARTVVVNEMDTHILRHPPKGAAPRLTLYTCTLPHSERRVVVVANLVETQPL